MTVRQLWSLYSQFEEFIADRSMYFVDSNIIKPMTAKARVSFAELVGPSTVQFFVSHYWGMPFRHLVESIVKHIHSNTGFALATVSSPVERIMSVASLSTVSGDRPDINAATYWICSLSVNQWNVQEELGMGDWSQASFYLALRSPSVKATVMVLDERALPLSRSWCLFELLQTFHLHRVEQRSGFEGLQLCTESGVLSHGFGSLDVVRRLASKARNLDLREASASCAEDKQMIEDLVRRQHGGFDAIQKFMCENIVQALRAAHVAFAVEISSLHMQLQRTEAVPPPHLSTGPILE